MNEMVERVAKALCESRNWGFVPRDPFEDQTEGAQRFFREVARAAIEAMREPTEAMIERPGLRAEDRGCGCSCCFHALDYPSMIDAALKEPETANIVP